MELQYEGLGEKWGGASLNHETMGKRVRQPKQKKRGGVKVPREKRPV